MTAIILVARFPVSLGCPMASSPCRAHRGVLSIRAGLPRKGGPMASSPCRAHRGVLSMRACSRRVGSQRTFGGEDAGDARIEARGLRESAAHRLERRLRNVMEVLAVVHVDVQGDFRVEGEGAEEVL